MHRTPRTPRTPRESRTPRTPRTAEMGHFLAGEDDAYQPLHQPSNLRRPPPWYQRSAKSIAIWVAVMCLIAWFASSLSWPASSLKKGPTNVLPKPAATVPIAIVSTTTVSETKAPSAVIIPGENLRWTVDKKDGLLSSTEYGTLCRSVRNVSMTVHEMHLGHAMAGHASYYATDDMFVDEGDIPVGTCERSLTFLMESGSEGGVGAVLMGLWLAYGLAKKEGRGFFVQDGDWMYGSYNDYFPPMEKPTCQPAPQSALLPCPHQAAHLLITTSTYSYVFGHMFEEEFEDPRKMGVKRQHNIFGMIREGYLALSKLNDKLEAIVEERVAAVAGPAVAVQVRRGNKHPMEWKYHNDYLPIERYLSVATNQTATPAGPIDYVLPDYSPSPVLIASDDPEVYHMSQVKYKAAQDTIRPKSAFWTAGDDSIWIKSAEERKLIAEGYLLDLRILGDTISDGGWAVCAVGGYACRILAVAMGWDMAIEKGHWVNVDGDFDWSGIGWS